MLSDSLKKLIGDDSLAKQIDEKLGEKVVVDIVTNDGQAVFIPKARFDTVNTKANDLDTKVKTLEAENGQLKDSQENTTKELNQLKESGADVETWKSKATELEGKNKADQENWKKERQEIIRDAKVRETLLSNGADPDYVDFLVTKVDRDKIVVSEDGSNITGLDMDGLKESQSKFFDKTPGIKNGPGHKQGGPGGKGDDDPPEGLYSREQLDGLSDDEYLENRDKAQKSMAHWGSQRD
jgi:hypothetical protein